MSSRIEDIIRERKFVLKRDLRESLKGVISDSTYYNRLNTLVKNREICEVELKLIWRYVVLNDLRRREAFVQGRLVDAYLWGYYSKLFKEILQYFKDKGDGRFSFKPYIRNKEMLILVSPNRFSENCRAKIKVLLYPEYPTELTLTWQSSQTVEININPGEEQAIKLFELKPSKEAEEWWGKPLKSVRSSLEEEMFKPPSERNQNYYEFLRMREHQYSRRYLLGTYPHLTGLAETDKNHEDGLMKTMISEEFAVIVFSVYCKDAYDRKLYLLYRQLESGEGWLEKYFLCYDLYEITKFTTRTTRGRKDKEYRL
ncbi:hypothetical protein J7L18_03685 [Candidatus Bathyarchaeota archaeon]|nr:hypothetical protein [Candidatus Bathyarchaeota archaeon]